MHFRDFFSKESRDGGVGSILKNTLKKICSIKMKADIYSWASEIV